MAFTLNSMFANGTTYRGLGKASTLEEDKKRAQADSNGEKKKSYGLEQFDKKEIDPHSYQAVYGKRPATFKDYFGPAIEKIKTNKATKKATKKASEEAAAKASEAAAKAREAAMEKVGKTITADDTIGLMGDGSSVFQKSDAYGKAMMRSGLYQKSYNEKKYK